VKSPAFHRFTCRASCGKASSAKSVCLSSFERCIKIIFTAGHVKLNMKIFFSFLFVQTSAALQTPVVFIFPPQLPARLQEMADTGLLGWRR